MKLYLELKGLSYKRWPHLKPAEITEVTSLLPWATNNWQVVKSFLFRAAPRVLPYPATPGCPSSCCFLQPQSKAVRDCPDSPRCHSAHRWNHQPCKHVLSRTGKRGCASIPNQNGMKLLCQTKGVLFPYLMLLIQRFEQLPCCLAHQNVRVHTYLALSCMTVFRF